MNSAAIEQIADAVLYEGYLLYPYRASAIKNQQRFNFGVLYPREYCDLQAGSDNFQMQTECLALATADAPLEVKVRFLTLTPAQAGVERSIVAVLPALKSQPLRQEFHFEGIDGELEIGAKQIDDSCFRITLVVRNRTSLMNAAQLSRNGVLLRSLISVHSILQVTGGEFVSCIDPPEKFKSAVAECQNIGAWPVLAGEEGQRDLMLASPIILYDYPQIAPESSGNLFDGTEIDEILALRILTMTDAEKLEIKCGDDRARQILERTEMLPPEHFQKLHGALRGLRPNPEASR